MARKRIRIIGETIKRNTPIATLISLFEDKRSGKVMESREEIKWRFRALDWEYQQRILTDFLQSGKLDRIWACAALLDLWDPMFEPKIKELWEQYHDDVCKWVVIRHLPIEYITQHMDEFTAKRDYYYICLRLAQDKDYEIETDRLSIADYLGVLFHTGRGFDGIHAETILFQIVHENCLHPLSRYAFDKSFDFHHPTDIFSPMDLRDVRRVFYYFRDEHLGLWDLDFFTWNKQVEEAIQASEEYQQLKSYADHFNLLDDWIREIMRKYAYIALPDVYKYPTDPSPEDMVMPLNERLAYKRHEGFYDDLMEEGEEDWLPFNEITSVQDVPF